MLVKYKGTNTEFKTFLGETFCDFSKENPIEIDNETAIQYINHPLFEVTESPKVNEISFEDTETPKKDKRFKDK